MSHVTRITQAEQLTVRKQGDLTALCAALGKVRAHVWRKYGSIKGVSKSAYEIRDEVCPGFKNIGIVSHVVQGTVLDAAKNIAANREAAKVEAVRAIFRHTKDENERKRLCTALKADKTREGFPSWIEDAYLRRQMRKHCARGHSKCVNQIVVPVDCYKWFEVNGRGFISVAGFMEAKRRVRRIAILLTTNHKIEGAIRLIVKETGIEVHYGIEAEDVRPCGKKTLGIDKGYTEVLVDSDNVDHGVGLGILLSAESDTGKRKGQALGKLRAIAKKSEPKKRARIEKNNLGKKKFLARRTRHHKMVSTLIHNAAHSVVSKAKVIATEDLTKKFVPKDLGANANRRLGQWVKGVIAKAFESVASRRGASVKLVNAAYTSQTCPDCLCFGNRSGDKFYCEVCKDVKRSDHVAARNTLARLDDPEIKLYTPYREVKEILLRRALPRLRLSNQDSSCVGTASVSLAASTESELLISTTGNCG